MNNDKKSEMPSRLVAAACTIFCALTLVACGGGSKPSEPQQQTIAFATPGTVSGAVGTTVTNTASGGGGTGEITYSSSNLSVASVNPISGVATLLTVGTTTITATKAASNGYNQATTSYTLTVTPGAQSIAFAQPGPLQVQVGSVVSNTASGGSGSGAIAYATSDVSVAIVNPLSGTVTVTGVGSAIITATKAADANYQQAQATYTVNATPASQTIAFAQAGPLQVAVGEVVNNSASGGDGSGAFSYATSNALVAMVDVLSGQATLIGSGSAIITATKAADASYQQAQTTYTLIVTPGVQSITFAQAGPLQVLVGASVNNTASGGNGSGAIIYATSDAAVATVNATTGAVTAVGTGAATITATKAADANYQQAQATYTVEVSIGTQTISFAQPGPLQILVGAVVNNIASGGVGTGAITYASSDPAIAAVNASTGAVTALTTGSATITATKAADASYESAQASYDIAIEDTVSVNAWVGETDALVTLSAAANGARFTRSGDRGCDLNNYAICTRGQQTIVANAPGTAIVDTAVTTSDAGYYWLQTDAVDSSPTPINVNRFSERVGHTALRFNNRYWVIGGSFLVGANAKSDVWSSTDGKVWELETASAAFGARWFHQSVVFDNKMWVIGGWDSNGFMANNVYSSTNGVDWIQVAGTTPFLPFTHESLNVAVFNGQMWALYDGDAYSSSDGVTWTLRNAASTITNGDRAGASLTAYNGRLWYIAGSVGFRNGFSNAGTAVNDVWSSIDGENWNLETASAPFSPRYRHVAFVLNNRLWVFGGQGANAGAQGAPSADAWSTADGVNWTLESAASRADDTRIAASIQESNRVTIVGGIQRIWSSGVYQSTDGNNWNELSPYAQFPSRSAAQTISFAGNLWMIGGTTLEYGSTNDIWRSADGANWSRVTPVGAIFSPRVQHQLEVFNGRLWLIGGLDDGLATTAIGRRNDVWSTADGVSWTPETLNAGFEPRAAFGTAVFNGRLWVVGGGTSGGVVNDVWSSVDGITWTQEPQSAPFSARSNHTLTVFNNQLWLLGGSVGSATNDVWRSADGRTWTLVSTVNPFSARLSHQSMVHTNRIWVIAGGNGGPYPTNTNPAIPWFNDVWSSADGMSWTMHTATAPFSPRTFHSATVHNNELWVIGGLGVDRHNDVWRSTDGVNWRVGFNGVIHMQ